MGNIQLLDRETGVLKIAASRGFDAPFLTFFETVHENDAACGTALKRGERIVVEDVEASAIFLGTPALDVLLAAGVRAVQSTPLFSRSGRLWGVLSTHWRDPRPAIERGLHLLDLLTGQLAGHIERKEAEQALRSEERRVGKECVRTCRFRGSRYH